MTHLTNVILGGKEVETITERQNVVTTLGPYKDIVKVTSRRLVCQSPIIVRPVIPLSSSHWSPNEVDYASGFKN